MDFAHWPNGPGLNPFHRLPDAFAGVAEVAHLGGDFGFAGRLG